MHLVSDKTVMSARDPGVMSAVPRIAQWSMNGRVSPVVVSMVLFSAIGQDVLRSIAVMGQLREKSLNPTCTSRRGRARDETN